MSMVGATGPVCRRSNACGSSWVSHSSMRLRSGASGNKAADGSGKGREFNIASRRRLLGLADCHSERLVQIGDDVVDVLEAHAQATASRRPARGELLGRRHLPMGGRGGMAGERLRIAQIHQTLEQLE